MQREAEAGGEEGEQLLSLCQTRFILDPEAKARIMQGEALLQKQHSVQASAINVTTLHNLCSKAWLVVEHHHPIAAGFVHSDCIGGSAQGME